MVRLGEVSPIIAEQTVERIEFALGHDDFEDEYEDLSWRKSANKNKFDRELFQKYGYMKDIILHPKFQHIKHYLEENADFNVFLGDPMLPTTTAIIILFMLNKRVSNNLLGLSALLIFNVNPLYVVLVASVFWLFTPSGKRTPRQYKKLSKESKTTIKHTITATSTTYTYDHVLIGSDIGTLYTAALLAKNGHRCCVLQPATLGQLFEIHPAGAPCAAPIMNAHVERIERYQALLDAAQSTNNDNNRVTFVPTGSEVNGYTSAVVQTTTAVSTIGVRKKVTNTLSCLRVGEQSLSFDLCTAFPLEKSALTAGLQRLYSALPFLTSFLVSRAVPATQWNSAPQSSSEGSKLFKNLSTNSVAEVVRTMSLEASPSAVAALEGMAVVSSGEALSAAECSGYALASALYGASQGAFYPIGGATAVAQALTRTIVEAGGSVFPSVQLKEVVLEEATAGSTYMAKATGVSVSLSADTLKNTTENNNNSNDSSDTSIEHHSEVTFLGEKSIVSGVGAIATFTKLILGEAVSARTAQMLSGLRESRPRVRVIYWLRGTVTELGDLSSTDYYEVGTQPNLLNLNENRSNEVVSSDTTAAVSSKEQVAQNEMKRNKFSGEFVHVWSPSCKDPSWASRNGEDLHVVIVELELTQPFIESKEVSFDQQYEQQQVSSNTGSTISSTEVKGPTIYYSLHNDDTISDPHHPDFDTALGMQVTTSKSKKDHLQQRADRILDKLYAGILNKVEFTYVHMPVLSGGAAIANTTEKFARPLSAITDIQNLYLTGRDLGAAGLAGDLQGGWVAANAVLGYQLSELITSRNIVSDLASMQQQHQQK